MEKSLYSQYVKEREGLEVLENSKSFAVYCVHRDNMFIKDFFVKKEFRQQGIGSDLLKKLFKIALDSDLKSVICQVDLKANGANHSLCKLLNRGFEVFNAEMGVLTLRRKL